MVSHNPARVLDVSGIKAMVRGFFVSGAVCDTRLLRQPLVSSSARGGILVRAFVTSIMHDRAQVDCFCHTSWKQHHTPRLVKMILLLSSNRRAACL